MAVTAAGAAAEDVETVVAEEDTTALLLGSAGIDSMYMSTSTSAVATAPPSNVRGLGIALVKMGVGG